MRPHASRTWISMARTSAFFALIVGACGAGACNPDFNASRPTPPPSTLGDDVFSIMCDRVAASEHPEDLEARYSHAVCHIAADGTYADDYDQIDMPPRMAVMVRYRKDFIEAINAMFPDKNDLHKDMQDLLKALVPLYDDDTIPESTRTMAAMMATIAGDPQVQAALAHFGGRKGYRTLGVGVGVARPMLEYQGMNDVIDTAISKFGAGGDSEKQMRKLLEVAQVELASTVVGPKRLPIATYLDRFSGVRGQHPKLTAEILGNLLVDPAPLKGDLTGPAYAPTWTDAYARDASLPTGVAPVVPFLVRDARGYALFSSLPPNAQDKDGDGLADVDATGRFLDKSGKPLAVDVPFVVPRYAGTLDVPKDSTPRDAQGRALGGSGAPLYVYRDASKTMLHSMLIDTKTLVDPSNGALLDLTHASLYQFGPRTAASDKTDPTVGSDSKTYKLSDGSTKTIKFRKFDGSQSPIADLVYAMGRFMEYPKSADYFEFTRQLMRDHPNDVARVIGAVLKIRAIANDPAFANVQLGSKSSLWDDVMVTAIKIAQEPDLLHDVLQGLADDDILLMSKGMSAFFANKDDLDYDPAADKCWADGAAPDQKCDAINHPAWNVTKGGAGIDPSTPVDLAKPDAEGNRSLFMRFASLIHDSSGVTACNKPGAVIHTKVLGISLGLPLFRSGYNECEVLHVPDLAVFYLGCIAGGTNEATGHPRCELPVSDPVVSVMKGILGSNAVDQILENSSGITDLKQVPTVPALNRLVFWRNPNKFVHDLTDPVPTSVCPVTDATTGHRTCASPNDLMWNRQRATIFMGEFLDALRALRPVVTPFVKKRGADKTGREQLFIDLTSTLHEHWGSGTNPVRCGDKKPGDPKYCAGDDVRQYEQMISKVFLSDLLPALHGLQKTVDAMTVNGQNGTDVMVAMINDLINPNNAKGMSLTDRKGNAGTTTNDGRPIAQTTPFYLFANALDAMDAQWVGPTADADHATWRSARSKIVDQFLTVDVPGGDFSKSVLHNQAVATSMPILVDLLDDRVAQHKAAGDLGTWARKDLVQSFDDSISGPLFASIMDVNEALYADAKSRQTMGSLLAYLAGKANANDALSTTVTVVSDMMQMMGDEENMVPLYHALSVGAAPDGATKRSLDLIERIKAIETSDEWKAAHGGRRVLQTIMSNAVTPMPSKDPKVARPSPIEVLIDCATDVNRADATSLDSFGPADFKSVAQTMNDFLVDPYRGLVQFYVIVKNRNAVE